jgi:hypothetical protein
MQNFMKPPGSLWVPVGSFLLALALSLISGSQIGSRPNLRAAAETSSDSSCKGDTHTIKDSKEVEIGDKKFKFGRDIGAMGRICRFEGFGIKMASVTGNEENSIILFNKHDKLYTVSFQGLNVNNSSSAAVSGNIGKNKIGASANGPLNVSNSVTVETEITVDPVFAKEVDVFGKKSNLHVTVPITVKPSVTLDTYIDFKFPNNGVDAVGVAPGGGNLAIKSSVALPISKGIPLAQGGLAGITLKLEVEITGELKYSDTRYSLDAHPRSDALNGKAESIFDGLKFKMGGKIKAVLENPIKNIEVTLFPEGDFFDFPLPGSTKQLY